jgi:CoA:oxalate CoA-transferase
MDRPLDGVRVLDLSRVLAGPIAGRILADLGADVIKVEPPDLDIARTVNPMPHGQSVFASHLNAGKRGMVVDLACPGAADLVARLAERCDVVLENFRPGVLDRFGLGPDELLARVPRLVYCSVSGWGHGNSWSSRRAYAPLVHAQVGTLEMAARLHGGPARQEVHVHGDSYAGMLATQAILAALFQRERTGRGQHLDVSMAAGLVYVDEWAPVEWQGYAGVRQFDIWTHPVLRLGDGSLVTLVGNPRSTFVPFVTALGADRAILDDPRFASREAIDVNIDAALGVLADLVGRCPTYADLERAIEGTPMLVAEVRSVTELLDTDWAAEVELVVEIEPGVPVARAPWRSSSSQIGARGPAPRPHEHGREVLADLLGIDAAGYDSLRSSGVFGAP